MRYERQILMPEIGQKGQQKLLDAHVTVIGAGGLGSPVLTYLACAGIGHLHIIDCDVVSESNLNRQFLHGVADINHSKTHSAREKLLCLNPELQIKTSNQKLTLENAESLLAKSDVIIDCVDNLQTRLIVGQAALNLNTPLVEGGIAGFYGYVTVITRETACLRCMGYHKKTAPSPIPVLGTTAGVVGSLQANECIKILLDLPGVLYGQLLNYDGLHGGSEIIPVMKDAHCPAHQASEKRKKDQ